MSEQDPLLQRSRDFESAHGHSQEHLDDVDKSHASHSWSTHWHNWRTIYICSILLFVIDFSSVLRYSSKLRLLENLVCWDHYRRLNIRPRLDSDGLIVESLCQNSAVQQQLADLRGWLILFIEGLPGLLLSIPYGSLADFRSKRLVASLSLAGQILGDSWELLIASFPDQVRPQAVWTCALFRILGGGPSVLSAVVLAVAADTIPDRKRTTAFFYLGLIVLVAELVAPPSSALLVTHVGAIWPFWIGLPLEALGFCLIKALPGDSQLNSVRQDPSGVSVDRSESPAQEDRPKSSSSPKDPCTIWQWSCSKLMLIALGVFVASKLSHQMQTLILLYASKRLGWPLSKTNYLLSAQAAVQIALLGVILPVLNDHLMVKSGYPPARAAWAISGVSLVLHAVGAVLLGLASDALSLATALVMFTLGFGFRKSWQSFMVSIVKPTETSRLYAVMVVVDSLGTLVAAPSLAWLYSHGLAWGRRFAGLPFFVSAAVFCILGLGWWFTKRGTDSLASRARS